MTLGIRRDRFALALDSLRWVLVAFPLSSTMTKLAPWTWPIAAVTLIASIPLLWLPSRPGWLLPAGLITLAAGSGLLWILVPHELAFVIVFLSVFYSARFLSRTTVTVVVTLAALTIATMFLRHQEGWGGAVLNLMVVAVVVLLGQNRRDRMIRAEQTELALARARTAAEEHSVAAALAERARIARELHDVLAHSLSGLALNLQGARLMLLRDGAGEEVIAQIERAQRLAIEGLAEARKAVAALRDDPVPLERAIADLLAGYRLDTSAAATLTVHGEPREIDAATSATVVRTVQEALTNSRKHAPGATVDISLTFGPRQVEVTVDDHQGTRPVDGPAGYGLRGMRERAELLGGRLRAGPGEDGWRVHLAVPA